MKNLEILIANIGEFGRYQKFVYFLICLTSVTCAFQALVSVYILAIPKSRCRLPLSLWKNDSFKIQSAPHSELISSLIPKSKDDSTQYDACSIYLWTNKLSDSMTVVNSNKTMKCIHGWVFDKTDFIDTFMTELELACDEGSKWKLIITQCFLGGLLAGSLIFGKLSDQIGRKPVFMIGVILQIISGFGSAFVKLPELQAVMRFLCGLATVGLFPVGFVISMEIVSPNKRTHIGIITEYFFGIGVCLIAGIANFIRYWQYLVICITTPSILFLPYWWLIPESPRWLIAHGHSEKAKEILQKMAKVNKISVPINMEVLQNEAKHENPSDEQIEPSKKSIYMEALRKPLIVLRILNIAFQWFVSAMLYYGLAYNVDSLYGNIYMNSFLNGLVEIAAYIGTHLTLDRFGRKIPHSSCFILGGIACVSTIIFRFLTFDGSNIVITVLALFGKFFCSAAFAIIYIWTAELYPTILRSLGLGISSGFARFGSLIAPVFFRIKDVVGGNVGESVPLGAFGLFGLAAGICSIFLPETLNEPLPQTIEDFVYDKHKRNPEEEINMT